MGWEEEKVINNQAMENIVCSKSPNDSELSIKLFAA